MPHPLFTRFTLRSAAAPLADPDEPVKAPGLAAAIKRHPHRVRQAGAAAIVLGIIIFGAAESSGTAIAGSPIRVLETPGSAAGAALGMPDPEGDVESRKEQAVLGATAAKRLTATPVHARKKAPATAAVITGLAANGIPNIALNAYRVAAARVDNADPGCGIDWALLAGIGREESDHGRFGGATLQPDGTSVPRIVGPALDGVTWDYIPAPGNGAALDGDPVYAHALGPMQFIPSTWAAYGADATGDGIADIFNINDAALGSARYLCAAGGNLRTQAGQIAAVLAYNHSDEYLAQVLALANAYRNGFPVSGIPVGNISGALPPLNSVGYVPPANPGAPTAVNPTASSGAKAKSSPGTATTTKPGTKPTSSGSAGSTGSAGSGSAGATTGSTGSTPTPAPSSSGGGGLGGLLGSGSSTSTPAPPPSSGSTPAPSSSPAPSPSPTKSCDPLSHILHLC